MYENVNTIQKESTVKQDNKAAIFAMISVIASGIVILFSVTIASFIFYHTCYKTKIPLSKTDLESGGFSMGFKLR